MEQEFLQKILDVLIAQNDSLQALRQENARLAQQLDGIATLCAALPGDLRPPLTPGIFGDQLDAVNRDIQEVFYSPQEIHRQNVPFLRYWQLLNLDLTGKRIGVLTTIRAEFPDILDATQAAECVEIRLHSIHGPLTVVTAGRSGGRVVGEFCGGLESALQPLEERDLLWIPDPALARLVLCCNSLAARLVECTQNFLFPVQTADQQEDRLRLLLHGYGFTEIRRIPELEATAYVTRRHEVEGFYVLAWSPPSTSDDAPLMQFLLASKKPSASFRAVPRAKEN